MRNKRLWFHVSLNAHIKPGIQIFARNRNSNLDPWLSSNVLLSVNLKPSPERCSSSSVCLHLPSSWSFDDAGRVVLSGSQSFEVIFRRGACSNCYDNSEEKRDDFHFWVQMSNCFESNWHTAFYIRFREWRYWGLRVFQHLFKLLGHLERSIHQTFRGARTFYAAPLRAQNIAKN